MSGQTTLVKRTLNFLHNRKRDYANTFQRESPDVQNTLKDLAEFCRADKTTFHQDARVSAALQGRQEVYFRIMDHLNLSTEELYQKYK